MSRNRNAALDTLASGWLREAGDLERRVAREALASDERKLLGMQARTRRACAEELKRALLQEGLRG